VSCGECPDGTGSEKGQEECTDLGNAKAVTMIAACISMMVVLLCVVVILKTAYLRSGASKALLVCGVVIFKICLSQETQQQVLRDATELATRPQQKAAEEETKKRERKADEEAADAMLVSVVAGPRAGRARKSVKGPSIAKGPGLPSIKGSVNGGMKTNQVLPLPSLPSVEGGAAGQKNGTNAQGEKEDEALAIAKRVRQEKADASRLAREGDIQQLGV
jgi:hypothetical protein